MFKYIYIITIRYYFLLYIPPYQLEMSFKQKPLLNNQNQHMSLTKKIEIEQQKLNNYTLQIQFLQKKRQQIMKNNQEKEKQLFKLKQDIKKFKEYQNPLIKQLRQHFKAIRQQLGQMMYQEEGDQIDIDNMTYEELLELEEKIGTVSKKVSAQTFQKLDKFQYQNDYNIQEQCTICLDKFQNEQECIRLGCMHFFHLQCAKTWCNQQKFCPNCKAEIL